MLKANIIRERLSELFVTSGTTGENDDGSDRETKEIALMGNQEPGGEVDELDLQISLGDSVVPYSADQKLPEEIGYIRLSVNEILRLIGIANAEMSKVKMAGGSGRSWGRSGRGARNGSGKIRTSSNSGPYSPLSIAGCLVPVARWGYRLLREEVGPAGAKNSRTRYGYYRKT